jgi:hypothetical protein
VDPSALRLIAKTKWQCMTLAPAGTETRGTRSPTSERDEAGELFGNSLSG